MGSYNRSKYTGICDTVTKSKSRLMVGRNEPRSVADQSNRITFSVLVMLHSVSSMIDKSLVSIGHSARR